MARKRRVDNCAQCQRYMKIEARGLCATCYNKLRSSPNWGNTTKIPERPEFSRDDPLTDEEILEEYLKVGRFRFRGNLAQVSYQMAEVLQMPTKTVHRVISNYRKGQKRRNACPA